MEMIDFAIVVLVAAIIGVAAGYIVRSRKKGKKCIGCPDGCSCSKNSESSCGGCSSCCGDDEAR